MEVTNRVRKPSTSASTENDTGPTTSSYVSLCVFATCCYGVCNWDDYVGRDTLMDPSKLVAFFKSRYKTEPLRSRDSTPLSEMTDLVRRLSISYFRQTVQG